MRQKKLFCPLLCKVIIVVHTEPNRWRMTECEKQTKDTSLTGIPKLKELNDKTGNRNKGNIL